MRICPRQASENTGSESAGNEPRLSNAAMRCYRTGTTVTWERALRETPGVFGTDRSLRGRRCGVAGRGDGTDARAAPGAARAGDVVHPPDRRAPDGLGPHR